MLNLQKLQNLATIQQHQQHQSVVAGQPSVMPTLAGLQGLAGLSSAAAGLNSPLNLSVGSTASASSMQATAASSVGGVQGGGVVGAMAGCSQMPQLILASGQLIQGVQGAQLLIPTSQGKYMNFGCGIYVYFKLWFYCAQYSKRKQL